MKYGVREVCDLVYKAGGDMKIGATTFKKGQPVLYIDSAKTSTMEGASTAVYAQGGSGNARLITWTGEKTMTFTVEDALISPIGLSILAGAGLYKDTKAAEKDVRVHKAEPISVTDGKLVTPKIDPNAPFYVIPMENGDLVGGPITGCTATPDAENTKGYITGTFTETTYFVDYYQLMKSSNVDEIQIDAKEFSGNFYVEGNTLFRDTDGNDHPAVLTFPNVKIQSNFSIAFAATGDPSTFTFTMDAMPGYTYFDKTKKVFVAIQVVDDTDETDTTINSLFDGGLTDTDVITNDSASGNDTHSI